MSKIKNILIAIDFSEPSLNALETAVSVAKKEDAAISIIHVQDTVFDFIGAATPANSFANNSSNILAAISNDIHRKSGINPVIIEQKGYVAEVILKTAMDQQSGLIVMGLYGATGHRDAHIGMNAYTVLKFAPCPVLLIPGGNKILSFKKPLFPVRPLVTGPRHYDTIRNFLSPYAILDILGLSTSGSDKLNDLVAEIKEKLAIDKVTTTTQLNKETLIPESVLDHAEKNKSDLIILTPAIDVSTKQFYVGPNAHRILQHTKVPVLIINKVNTYAGVKM